MNRAGHGLTLLIVLSLAVLQAATVAGQDVLTNDSIVSMKKAGLSDAVVIARIRSGQTRFDLSTPALVSLKNAGVSDQVVEVMVARSAPPPPAPGPGAMPPGPRASDSVFHLSGDTPVELAVAFSSVQTSYAPFGSKVELVLKGRKAQYRIAERTPVFLSVFSPNEMPLVRLKPGDDHDDRNLKVSSGSFAPFGGSHTMGVRSEDTIDVESERQPTGLYRIKPRKPLAPGEYGFVVTHGFTARTGKVHDFGVD